MYERLEANARQQEERKIEAKTAAERVHIAKQNAQLYAANAMREKRERADRIALEDAQAEAMRAKIELAKLQAT